MGNDKEKKCLACNGEGGRWDLAKPGSTSGNGKRNPGQTRWYQCEHCNGTGKA